MTSDGLVKMVVNAGVVRCSRATSVAELIVSDDEDGWMRGGGSTTER